MNPFYGLRLRQRGLLYRKPEVSILLSESEPVERKSGLRREKKIIPSRTAIFLIRWQWLPMLLSAPLIALPSPWPLIPLCVVPTVLLAIWMAGGKPIIRTPLNIPILVIAIMILISIWATYDLKISIGYIAGAVLGLGAFFTITRYSLTIKGWWICFFFYSVMNIGMAVVVSLMVKFPQKIGFLNPVTSHFNSPFFVLSILSVSPHPNNIPYFLLGIVPLLIVFSVSTLINRRRVVTIIGPKRTFVLMVILMGLTLVSGFVLLLSQSRSAYFSFAVTCLFLLWAVITPRLRWLLLGSTVVCTIVIVVLWQRGFLATIQEVFGRTYSENPALSLDTLQGRVEIWSRAIDGIQDFSFTGMGMNTFEHVWPTLYPRFGVGSDVVILNAHNTYLQAALDLGIPGLIAFLGVQFGTFWMLLKIWRIICRRQDSHHIRNGFPLLIRSGFLIKAIVLGLGGGMLAYLVFGLTESVGLGGYMLIWSMIGLINGLYRQVKPTYQDRELITVQEIALQRG